MPSNSFKKQNNIFLTLFSGFLLLIGIAFVGFAVWFLIEAAYLPAAASFATGLINAAAGWGIYKRRRWGVVLLGLISMLALAYNLAKTLLRLTGLTGAGFAEISTALISVLGAVIIIVFASYLIISMWKQLS